MKVGIVIITVVILATGGVIAYWFFRTPAKFNNGVPDFVESSPEKTENKLEIQDTEAINPTLVIGSDSAVIK